MFQLKYLIILISLCGIPALLCGQDECFDECINSDGYKHEQTLALNANNDFNLKPTRENGYYKDFYKLNLLLRLLECRTICGDYQWPEEDCQLYFDYYYETFVNKWANTIYYDGLCSLLNTFMNDNFGCNVPSPC